MNNILSINNLSKSYNSLNGEVLAVNNISLDVRDREFLSIIGSSGVKISYMLQEDSLFPWLSVYNNAILGLKIQKKLTKENEDYVKYLLNKYGLSEFQNKKVSSLSGGMRQRVALIRTIATKPNLILLDEPFSALDYQTRLKVSDDIYKIIKEEGVTVIMVTHDIAEAISMSDRIVVLSKRPATIKNIYDINLTDKSTPIENRKAPEFSKYYDLLWRDIDE